MLDQAKTKALLGLGGAVLTSFIIMMGYTAGQHSTAKLSNQEIERSAKNLLEEKEKEEKSNVLSSETVKEFLTQYLTKEKLGENNSRI